MIHSEFINKYNNGEIKIHVNRSLALRVMNTKLLPKRYQYAHIFWSWVWILSIPAAIVCIIWVKWWVGLLVLVFVTPVISKATKKSACQFMIDHALEDQEFYNYAIEKGIIICEENKRQS